MNRTERSKRLLVEAASRLIWLFRAKKAFLMRVPVLCYHRVLPDYADRDNKRITVTPGQFAEQMAYLASNGFRSLSLQEFLNCFKDSAPLPARGVLITFDDGYADFYSMAYPIAHRYGMNLNIFVPTGLIGGLGSLPMSKNTPCICEHTRRFPDLWRALTWDEIRELKNLGIGIGAHGHTHRDLAGLSDTELGEEISACRTVFKENLQSDPTALALPFGSSNSYNRKVLQVVREAGIELIFCSMTGRPSPLSMRCPLPRLVIRGDDDIKSFERKLFGAFDWVEGMRRAEQSVLGTMSRR